MKKNLSKKKAVYFQSIHDFNAFIKVSNLNDSDYLIYTSSGAVIEILKKKKLSFLVLNYTILFEKLIKYERKNFSNFYKNCINFEKKIFNKTNSLYTEINGYYLQYLFSFLITKYLILNELIKKLKKKKIKNIILFNEEYDFLSLSNPINPWLEIFSKDKDLEIKIIESKNIKILNYKTILLDFFYNFKTFLISASTNKKIIYCDRLSYDLRIIKSKDYIFVPIKIIKNVNTDFFWQKTLINRKLLNKKKNLENFNKNYSYFLNEFIKVKKNKDRIHKISMELIKKPLFMMFCNFENLFKINYNFINNLLICKKPKSIIFNSSTHWILKLISIIAKQKKIPVLSIQHGGGYGTHDNPRLDFNDYHYSDYFLSYGRNFFYNKTSYMKFIARVIPIGNIFLSKKLETKNIFQNNLITNKIKLLYISDGNSDNFLCYAKRKYPDLILYFIQKKILTELYKDKNLEITYRPFFTRNEDNIGTVSMIKNNFHRINIDNKSDIYEQIEKSDIIITDSSVGTVISQCIVHKKKIIFVEVSSISKPFKKYYNDLKKVVNIIKYSKIRNLNIKNYVKKIIRNKPSQKNFSKFIKNYISPYSNLKKTSSNFINIINSISKKN